MYDMYKGNDCGCSSRPEHDHKHDDKNDKVCDIKSECCNGFVKEQFTIRATATPSGVTVYDSSNPVFTRATIKIKNLSQYVVIRVQASPIDINVDPNQEVAFSVDQLNAVVITALSPSITASSPSMTARVLLCFDLQFSSPGPACCPSGGSHECCPEGYTLNCCPPDTTPRCSGGHDDINSDSK